MAPRKKADSAESAGSAKTWVLKSNFGLITHGRNSHFFEAGSEFEDGNELIPMLISQGAELEEK